LCITHPLITLTISIEEVSRLHIHEEIIPDVVDKLGAKIEVDGRSTNPIIADEKSREHGENEDMKKTKEAAG